MTKILIFSDFDGTITGREGANTVFCTFYNSLMVDVSMKESPDDYRSPPFKGRQELQALFEEKFGSYDTNFTYSQPDADLLMSADAVAFFKEALNNPAITVNIISKNRKDYIYTLFRYHQFTEDEINQLLIDDSGVKSLAVSNSLLLRENVEQKPSYLYILDDNAIDFQHMIETAEHQVFGFSPEQIKKYHENPGTFNWRQYQNDIKGLLTPTIKYNAADGLKLMKNEVISDLTANFSKTLNAVLQVQSAQDNAQALKTEVPPQQTTTRDSLQHLKHLGGPINSSRTITDEPVDHYPSILRKSLLPKDATMPDSTPNNHVI